MTEINLDVHKVAKIFKDLQNEPTEQVCMKHSLNSYQLKDVIEAYLNASDLYTKNNLSRYLGIPHGTTKYWFEDETFPKEIIILNDKTLEVVNLKKYWDWMYKNRRSFNYSKIKLEAVKQAGSKITSLYKKSLRTINHKDVWTKYEEDLLRALWGIVTMAELCKRFGRTKEAILNKRGALGLPAAIKSGTDMTCADLAKIIGYRLDVIDRWEEKYSFPVIRRIPTNGKKPIRFVDVKNFWVWARKNKGVVDLTSCELEQLTPVPIWAYREKAKQLEVKERNNHYKRVWTKGEILKLIYLREVEGIGFPTLAKKFDRKTYIVSDKFSELKAQDNFEELLSEAKLKDYSKFISKRDKQTPEFSEEKIMRLLHLTTLPKFNWEFASKILDVPKTTLKRRHSKLQESANFENILKKAAETVYEEYIDVFKKYDEEHRANKTKGHWTKEDLERMLYLLEIENMTKTQAAEILNRSENAVDYQYRMLKKQLDFEEMVKKLSRPKNRFVSFANK